MVNASLSAEQLLYTLRKVLSTEEPYPQHEPLFCGNENKYVQECIDTG